MNDSYWGYAKGIVDKMIPFLGDNRGELCILVCLADRTVTWKESRMCVDGSYSKFARKQIRKHRTVGLPSSERSYYRDLGSLVSKNVVCRKDTESGQVIYLNLPYIISLYMQELIEEDSVVETDYYNHVFDIQVSFHRLFLDNSMPVQIPMGKSNMKIIDAIDKVPVKTAKRREKKENKKGKTYSVHDAVKKINKEAWRYGMNMNPGFFDYLEDVYYRELGSVKALIKMFPDAGDFDSFVEDTFSNWPSVYRMLICTQRYNLEIHAVDLISFCHFKKEIKEYLDGGCLPDYSQAPPLYEMEEGDDEFDYFDGPQEEDISLDTPYYN